MATVKEKTKVAEEVTPAVADVPAAETDEKDRAEEIAISCYIGPNIVGVIQANTIYAGSVKATLESPELKFALEKHPGIAQLVVSGEELAAARQKVKTKGTELYKAYRAVIKNLK